MREVENPELAEQLLEKMTDKEILGNHSIIDLLKKFHPDTIKSQWIWFNQEVREKITIRLLSIKKNLNQYPKGEENNSWNKQTWNFYPHENVHVSQIMNQAIIELNLKKDTPLNIIKKYSNCIEKLTEIWVNIEMETLYLFEKTEEKLINFLESQSGDTIFASWLPDIHADKLLDEISKLEKTYNLDWSLVKTFIIQYVADDCLLRNHHKESARRKITILGNKYRINTRIIRRQFSKRKRDMFPQHKDTHPKHQSTPRSYKKHHK